MSIFPLPKKTGGPVSFNHFRFLKRENLFGNRRRFGQISGLQRTVKHLGALTGSFSSHPQAKKGASKCRENPSNTVS